MDRALADFLTKNQLADPEDWSALYDAERVRALLLEAARSERALSYSEILARLGFRFTRPKMRALCRTLDAIDAAASTNREPELAVLVVRESDGLPGQGWWTGRRDYDGVWTGQEAKRFVRQLQGKAFSYWS
ncbi:ribose-phosphate pyrophosphokinase [Erythrobacter sp. F6033]|uniref:ribose-phosphate pyrophosphokinase n=1 Tax=Erythrobacter sp. F6033 TaxID=2926401 RepID=UPI001FF6EAB7|nr:ribose-phosphate pyrophosphokinase [Erythrobacter sp. F6033]MCK0129561.1 ribose-phosphate pyrophosphokinase [Erythrobacter sp. F6033]